MRLRSQASSPVGPMEKGPTKNQHSQLCLLASLSAFFWLSLLYFHFVILGAGTVDDSARILDSNISTRILNSNISAASVDLVKSPPLNAPSNSITQNPKNVHLAPPIWPSNTSSLPDSHQSVNDSSSNAQVHPAITDRQKTNNTHFASDSDQKAHNVSSSEAQAQPAVADDHKGNGTQHKEENFPFMKALRTVDNKSDPCGGRYIYVHDLPPKFNEDMLKECKSLSKWTNMCKFTTNAGLGPPLENVEGVFSETGWYATNQFAVDVIFNNRMKQYECLTNDSSLAAAVFVPFYAGFDIARYLWGFNTSVRDAASLELVDWLMKKPEWNIMNGHDHFLVAGRITWDFRRLSDDDADWGSKLLFLSAAKNMSMLVVESSPWNANDFGIPYPTYFHPAKDSDVFKWQDRMRNLERKWLFSFAGAPRPDNPKSIRGKIIDQCKVSDGCTLLECDFGESKCHSPSSIMKMFQSSLFCLQPQGDSYTRRSAFDSMLAGCIPVFFHPGSAYTQYTWHLPKNYSKYSVFIPEDDIRKRNMSIEQRLSEISPEQVRAMREEVINLIPSLIYADPRSKLETLKDAFDVAVQAVINKVTKLRRDIINDQVDKNFIEELSWKYALLEEGQYVGKHEWDPFFSKPKGEQRQQ